MPFLRLTRTNGEQFILNTDKIHSVNLHPDGSLIEFEHGPEDQWAVVSESFGQMQNLLRANYIPTADEKKQKNWMRDSKLPQV